MVFFVDPNKEGLVVVVPDASSIRPVTAHARRQEQWGHWLVEEEVILQNRKR